MADGNNIPKNQGDADELNQTGFDIFGDSDESGDEIPGATSTVIPRPMSTLIDRVTVQLSGEERQSQTFSTETISKATSCLRVHGIVIIPQVFDKTSISKLGEAALFDFKAAELRAAESGIEKSDWCFHELACREECRFELRRCPNLDEKLENSELNLCGHRGIQSILNEVCAAPGYSLKNEVASSIIPGDVGVFVSEPGACNQRFVLFV